ncbi:MULTISPECIES: RNA polymerase sigma factor [Celeribacter]|jgi:RNA polymerase sigma-70 factor (ECF subfamily)|uniref:RNA polymerase sigma factor n=1 Tax=Celeribacter halophilus TaxID=576117 RepID=A0A1I3P7I7_9RHOB|nr:RNA polymerase sigma factor [Celeribacter halophilus]MBU2888622.1 RNA polymerase sigma factor [Celeribacter halophilus]MDO6457356.1 RNA polymerase sigma factor [Celeribacter halophilus]MDO6509023.1 RNA polymerase sigma factor [Celeribacter halophilus]MDO6722191.1 RNA polymerase sigma factor [Celeribacter halophilus]PZX14791.1 RNA polymerase sigma-70 factor (ECF subfamily) [Celeribacter halophilus]
MTNKDSPPQDESALDPREEIVTHLPAMRAFALSLTRNSSQADDLVQDAVIKAWKNMASFQAGTNMRAWLFTILRNTFYSDRRKHRREVQDTDGAFAATLAEKPDHDGRLAMADFETAFVQLKPEQREALMLVGAMGFSYEEAAETCEVAVGTIKSRVNRARQSLVGILGLEEGASLELTDQETMAVMSSAIPGRGNAA